LYNIPEFLPQDCGNQKTVLTQVSWSKFEFRLPDEEQIFFPQSAPIFGVMGLCKVNMMIILVGKHKCGYRVLRFSRFVS